MSSNKEILAKKAAIFSLLVGYHQLAEKLTDDLLASFLRVVDDCRVDAVKQACDRLARGAAPGVNSNFPPTPADLAVNARLFEDIAARREARSIPQYGGLLNVDYGHGLIDMRGLSIEEQDVICRLHGRTVDGRNFALLSLEEKKAAVSPEGLASLGPWPAAAPKLQRM